MGTVRKALLLTLIVLLILLVAASTAFGARPKHVLLVVMDQMKPEYAQQYHMKNLLWLQNNGVWYPNAYVGDMASETVVSHNVMVSGLFPQHMGWSDEVLRDTGNALGYDPGAIITVGDLGTSAYEKLIKAAGDYPKLGDYLHQKFPGSIVANVGEKGYQVESMAALSSDYWVRFGSKLKTADLPDPSVVPWKGTYRGPSGNVPSYIKSNPRYLASVGNDLAPAAPNDYYGTKTDKPAWLYPEDGRYVKGPYAGHESGDMWVADAAIDIMNHENWSGLWVTFSAIDKIGHMWGGGDVDTLENYQWDPASIFREVHMPWAAQNADQQLGRLIATLKANKDWGQTLIVVTADHGSTYGQSFHGVDAYDGGNTGWYYDPNNTCKNTTYGRAGANNAAVLAPLNADGNLAYSYQSTAIEAWLIDQSWGKKVTTAAAMKSLPGVIATYIRDGDHYVLDSTADMTDEEYAWWSEHGQELVDTMAFDGAADVVGLLADRTLYAAYGDHGGAQMDVQKIPMAFYIPGISRTKSAAEFRLVDIMPTVLRSLGVTPTSPMDGKAYKLPIPGAN